MLNIAHRGFSSQFPENTLIAFEEAMKIGADGFECDLRLTSDGHVVIFHDDDLKRLCGAKGSVEKSTLSELKKLKVKGEDEIPTLEEVLSQFHTTRINLEIKASDRPAVIVEEVLRVLTKNRPQGPILFTSFSNEIMRVLQTMDPARKLGQQGLLVETEDIASLPESLSTMKPDTWNVPKQILRSPWAKRWKDIKIPSLWAWTLDEPDEWGMALCSDLPIDGVITNRPGAFRDFIELQRLA
jgi:glycerophosphoryl diester phosphodiesterase